MPGRFIQTAANSTYRLFDNGNERLPVPLMCLVGASNELPESEELDALYDRFLIRRQVSQVTSGQLSKLARLAAGRAEPSGDLSTDSQDDVDLSGVQDLTLQDFKDTAFQAYGAIDVPESVIDVLTSLRDYLQVRHGFEGANVHLIGYRTSANRRFMYQIVDS